ncbi:MAG: WHG domain-containing protein [Acidimicrobiales bacterium]
MIEEAEQMADQVGLSNLTLAALAERLGVRQPSLYKHITGISGLQRSIAVRAKNQLAATLSRATVGRARNDAVISLSHAYRTWAREHPGRYAAAQWIPTPGDTEAEAADWASVEIVGVILAGYHLDGDDAIDATRALRASLHGFVTLEGSFAHPASIDRSFDRLVQGLATALANWSDQTDTTATTR